MLMPLSASRVRRVFARVYDHAAAGRPAAAAVRRGPCSRRPHAMIVRAPEPPDPAGAHPAPPCRRLAPPPPAQSTPPPPLRRRRRARAGALPRPPLRRESRGLPRGPPSAAAAGLTPPAPASRAPWRARLAAPPPLCFCSTDQRGPRVRVRVSYSFSCAETSKMCIKSRKNGENMK